MALKAHIYDAMFRSGVEGVNKHMRHKIDAVVNDNFKPNEVRNMELFVFSDIHRTSIIYYVCVELSARGIRIVDRPSKATCTMTITEDAFIKIKMGKSSFRSEFEMGELNVDGEYWLRDFLIFDDIIDCYRSDNNAVSEISKL